ncbi:CopG family transcriptional regulator [Bacillus infantis]|nr:CopG family transcriptional regulator [Bacillus infantis]
MKVGRPSYGETKKVSITLPEEVWKIIEEKYGNKSAYFRSLVQKEFDEASQ